MREQSGMDAVNGVTYRAFVDAICAAAMGFDGGQVHLAKNR